MIQTDTTHTHTYDEQGRRTCCTQEDRIYSKADEPEARNTVKKKTGHSHEHSSGESNKLSLFLPGVISFVLLAVAIVLDSFIKPEWFAGWLRVAWFTIAYIPVGLPVLKDAVKSIGKGDVFSEFLLMGIATIGAFAIGQYAEGVAVMLFYSVGEIFQTLAVRRAKANIKSLLDQRPDEVTVLRNNQLQTIKAEHACIGDIIQLKPGEKSGLDGELLSESASFNTAALTGESKPDTKYKGESVLAGMISINSVVQIRATAAYRDSKLSRILELVQNATSQKAPTELFIRKFAKVYTPIVVFLALGICLLPYFLISDYVFTDWLYRALVFLVISCPCALVISIPLGYFGGVGAASRNGILFKGSNFLDVIANVQHVVMDKTGTLTEGVFDVQEVILDNAFDQSDILRKVSVLESYSTHPVATAIQRYVGNIKENIQLTNIEEIPGLGMMATLDDKKLLVGNFKLLDMFKISYPINPASIVFTTVAIAYDKTFVGYITIADKIKEDAEDAVDRLHKANVKITMLSGDKSTVVGYVAGKLGIENSIGDLLPEDKLNTVKGIKANNETVAFVGDGVNDAPVIAFSDVGIAMGGLGSDATIETADIVIQDDRPGKIATAIAIGKQTKRIVWQNITMAFVVKVVVLLLGAGGLATMWEAVFADVGVALLAILNAVRIQRMTFD
ncbi:MAG TPA: heavy metal translocating P-type ATPase [Cyclobacteriaceae bacterium]|nr:heavy metal translocating P-type ATPase [Cyclobacteriaceae bacterium]